MIEAIVTVAVMLLFCTGLASGIRYAYWYVKGRGSAD